MDKSAAKTLGTCIIIAVIILVVGINMAVRSLGESIEKAGGLASSSFPARQYIQLSGSGPQATAIKVEIKEARP